MLLVGRRTSAVVVCLTSFRQQPGVDRISVERVARSFLGEFSRTIKAGIPSSSAPKPTTSVSMQSSVNGQAAAVNGNDVSSSSSRAMTVNGVNTNSKSAATSQDMLNTAGSDGKWTGQLEKVTTHDRSLDV